MQRRVFSNVVALGVLLIVALVVAAIQQPWRTDEPGPRTSEETATDVSVQLAAAIRNLDDAESRAEFVKAAGESKAARDWALTVWQNLELLNATDVQLRYISGGDYMADDGSTSAEVSSAKVSSAKASSAKVSVAWTPGQQSILASSPIDPVLVSLQFDVAVSEQLEIVGAEPLSGPIPLWLAGKLKISSVEGGSVVTIDGGGSEYLDGYVTEAHRAVERTLPRANSDIVVISSATETQAAAVLGEPVDGIGQLAAITTSVSGTSSGESAKAIFVNPAVFGPMGDRAAQIVMTHEATHLMTGATGSTAPNWLIEGFADYVALRDDTAPLSISAGQILRDVKESGPPEALPSRADFELGRHGLGATYEAAWMVFRMLGERFSTATIVEFYRSVLNGDTIENALDTYFDLTVQQLTEQWQNYLVTSL